MKAMEWRFVVRDHDCQATLSLFTRILDSCNGDNREKKSIYFIGISFIVILFLTSCLSMSLQVWTCMPSFLFLRDNMAIIFFSFFQHYKCYCILLAVEGRTVSYVDLIKMQFQSCDFSFFNSLLI